MANRVRPGLLSTRTRPPCAVVTASTMARPSPVLAAPLVPRDRAESPRTNRSNRVGCSSGGMPGPSSVTVSSMVPGCLARGQRDGDHGAWGGVLGGVAHQVGQHLVQPVLIAADHDRLAGQFEYPAVVGGGGPGVAGGVDGQPGQVHGFLGQRAAGVELGEQQQLVDQHAHPLGFRFDPAQRVLDVGRDGARVAQREFGVAADGGERGAQFVAGVGGEAAQPGLAGGAAAQG